MRGNTAAAVQAAYKRTFEARRATERARDLLYEEGLAMPESDHWCDELDGVVAPLDEIVDILARADQAAERDRPQRPRRSRLHVS
jgi:hypothetical protein